MGAFAATLATISAATYSNSLAGLPPGFTGLALPGTFGGVYLNENAAASVTTGVLDGQNVVVLAFRGSDDRADWLNNLRNINADYAKFAPLIAAVEQYAAQNNLPVLVTGHSLGGGLAQVFMANHPETGALSYQAVTFGSPGALIAPASDPRITSFEIADDLIPYVGEYRLDIGAKASGDLVYANAVASVAAGASGGSLSLGDVAGSLSTFTANYVSRGETVLLPDSDGRLLPFTRSQILDAADLVQIATDNQARHDIRLYAASSLAVADPLTYVSGAEANIVKLWSLYDSFVLGGGLDVAVASGNRADYAIARQGDGSLRITDQTAGRDGVDAVSGAERLSFDDAVLAFDINGAAGQGYRLYEAAFNRTPDTSGLTFWVKQADAGTDVRSIASSFVSSAEFQSRYGAGVSDQQFVTLLYNNALDRAPEAAGLAFWVNGLAGSFTRADVLLSFSESAENQAQVAAAIQNGILLNHDWGFMA